MTEDKHVNIALVFTVYMIECNVFNYYLFFCLYPVLCVKM